MKQRKWIGTGCLSVVLSMVVSVAWSAPQDQPQKPPYTPAEYNAFLTAHNENDAQAKIKLLDDFAVKYPTSALVPDAYRDSYLEYYSMRNYSKTVEYADKLLALADKISLDMRLETLVARAQAYCIGSGDPAFQVPEAHTRAKDAATQGLQMLSRWQKPQNMIEAQFAAQKRNMTTLFSSVAGFADSGLKGDKSAVGLCRAAPGPNSGAFDRTIDQIKSQERQSPRVR
jgi:hypothetical protein